MQQNVRSAFSALVVSGSPEEAAYEGCVCFYRLNMIKKNLSIFCCCSVCKTKPQLPDYCRCNHGYQQTHTITQTAATLCGLLVQVETNRIAATGQSH